MKIVCDSDHIYWVNGHRKPGVTEILSGVGLIDTTWFTEESAIRGQFVHKAVELYHTAGLSLNSLDSKIRPYFMAYLDFLRVSGFRVGLVEKKLWDQEYDFCGTPDLVGVLNGMMVVIDIKSGLIPPHAGPQTAAYKQLLNILDEPIHDRYVLNLLPTGKWKLIPQKNRNDFPVFLAALTVKNFKDGKL